MAKYPLVERVKVYTVWKWLNYACLDSKRFNSEWPTAHIKHGTYLRWYWLTSELCPSCDGNYITLCLRKYSEEHIYSYYIDIKILVIFFHFSAWKWSKISCEGHQVLIPPTAKRSGYHLTKTNLRQITCRVSGNTTEMLKDEFWC